MKFKGITIIPLAITTIGLIILLFWKLNMKLGRYIQKKLKVKTK